MALLLQPRAAPPGLQEHGKEAHREDRRVPEECSERRLRVQVIPHPVFDCWIVASGCRCAYVVMVDNLHPLSTIRTLKGVMHCT